MRTLLLLNYLSKIFVLLQLSARVYIWCHVFSILSNWMNMYCQGRFGKFVHCFRVFGYPGETIARVVYMASQMNRDMYFLAVRKNNGD